MIYSDFSTRPSVPLPLAIAVLVAALAFASGCAQGPQATNQAQGVRTQPSTPAGTPAVAGATSSPSASAGTAVKSSTPPSPGPSAAAPSPCPEPTTASGCRQGPCATALEYAVNGCTCAGQIYDAANVTAQYCCNAGFSNSECPEALQDQALAESLFGSTQAEVEAHLVTVRLQGWPALVHEKAASAYNQVAAKIENMSYRIVEPVQSYYWRDVGGHQVLSFHSFGLAVDINPSTNIRCGVTGQCRCNNELVTDMTPEFVQAFKDAGFQWGGDWVEQPDPMHFEWDAWMQQSSGN